MAVPEIPVIAEVIRSGFTESWHRGSAVALDAGGHVVLALGEVTGPMFPRSANKPVQAAAMLACGLDLEGKLLALAAASHSGEPFHITGVREILASAGLSEQALQCPPALPLDEEAQQEVLRSGGRPERVYMNCSGKHSAMLATCVAAGWPTASYRDPDHPLQREIRRMVSGLAGEPVAAVGVDGCGAPIFAVSLTGLAKAFRALVLAAPSSPQRKVADAMRAHPDWTAGTTRAERALMEAVPGLLVKSGAEGVQAFALADGRAAAFKIEDGAHRAVPAVAVAVLRMLGVEGADGAVGLGSVADVEGTAGAGGAGRAAGADMGALGRIADVPVHGGGEVVGQIRALLPAASGNLPATGPSWGHASAVLAGVLAIASKRWLSEVVSPMNVGSIGEYIRQQREQAKISLRQLASTAGVSNPYLSQIERGLRRPSAEILQQIAKGLRISAEALYVQAGILEDREPDSGVRAAVLAAPDLTERQKQVLLEIYESFRQEMSESAEVVAVTERVAPKGAAAHSQGTPAKSGNGAPDGTGPGAPGKAKSRAGAPGRARTAPRTSTRGKAGAEPGSAS